MAGERKLEIKWEEVMFIFSTVVSIGGEGARMVVVQVE